MNPKLKTALAVVAGIIAGGIVIAVVETITTEKPPEGLDFNNKEQMAEYVKGLPFKAFAYLMLAYFLGSVAAGYVANLLARSADYKPALIAGFGLFVFGSINLFLIPHPLWFSAVSSLLYFAGAWIGGRLVAPARAH